MDVNKGVSRHFGNFRSSLTGNVTFLWVVTGDPLGPKQMETALLLSDTRQLFVV